MAPQHRCCCHVASEASLHGKPNCTQVSSESLNMVKHLIQSLGNCVTIMNTKIIEQLPESDIRLSALNQQVVSLSKCLLDISDHLFPHSSVDTQNQNPSFTTVPHNNINNTFATIIKLCYTLTDALKPNLVNYDTCNPHNMSKTHCQVGQHVFHVPSVNIANKTNNSRLTGPSTSDHQVNTSSHSRTHQLSNRVYLEPNRASISSTAPYETCSVLPVSSAVYQSLQPCYTIVDYSVKYPVISCEYHPYDTYTQQGKIPITETNPIDRILESNPINNRISQKLSLTCNDDETSNLGQVLQIFELQALHPSNVTTMHADTICISVTETDQHRLTVLRNNRITVSNNQIQTSIHGMTYRTLIDTGAACQVLAASVLQSQQIKSTMLPPTFTQARMANSTVVPFLGRITLPVLIHEKTYSVEFHVLPTLNTPVILGMPFLQQYSAKWDFSTSTLILCNDDPNYIGTNNPPSAECIQCVYSLDPSVNDSWSIKPSETKPLILHTSHHINYDSDFDCIVDFTDLINLGLIPAKDPSFNPCNSSQFMVPVFNYMEAEVTLISSFPLASITIPQSTISTSTEYQLPTDNPAPFSPPTSIPPSSSLIPLSPVPTTYSNFITRSTGSLFTPLQLATESLDSDRDYTGELEFTIENEKVIKNKIYVSMLQVNNNEKFQYLQSDTSESSMLVSGIGKYSKQYHKDVDLFSPHLMDKINSAPQSEIDVGFLNETTVTNHNTNSYTDINNIYVLPFYSEKSPTTGFLSPFFQCEFKYGNHKFQSLEMALAYLKAKLFRDWNAQCEILKNATLPLKCRIIAGQIKNFSKAIWLAQLPLMLRELNTAKFQQNPTLKDKLLNTAGYILAYTNSHDKILGTGLGQSSQNYDPRKWCGLSILGHILVEIREVWLLPYQRLPFSSIFWNWSTITELRQAHFTDPYTLQCDIYPYKEFHTVKACNCVYERLTMAPDYEVIIWHKSSNPPQKIQPNMEEAPVILKPYLQKLKAPPKPKHIQFDFADSTLSKEKQQEVTKALSKYTDAFAYSIHDLELSPLLTHKVKLIPGATPVFIRSFNVPKQHRDILFNQLSEWYASGVVANSYDSAWQIPCFVTKSSRESLDKGRTVIDARPINSLTELIQYQIPKFQELVMKIGDQTSEVSPSQTQGLLFSKLDVTSAFLSIGICPQSQKIFTIGCEKSIRLKFLRACFGYKNSVAIFAMGLNKALEGLESQIMVFFDDILIASPSTGSDTDIQKHMEIVSQVFERLISAKFKVKPHKVSLFRQSLTFLGWELSNNKGLSISPFLTKAIRELKPPSSRKELQRLCGFLNFFRSICPNMSSKLRPWHRLLKQTGKWEWKDEDQNVFEQMQSYLLNANSLGIVQPNSPHKLELIADSSEHCIGSVLVQNQRCPTIDPHKFYKRPIGYFSKTLPAADMQKSIWYKELLAIFYSIEYFNDYLVNVKFIIKTDNKIVSYILNQSKKLQLTPKMQRMQLVLSMYDYEVIHIKGETNPADFLSRINPLPPVAKDAYFIKGDPTTIITEGIHQNQTVVTAMTTTDKLPLCAASVMRKVIINNDQLVRLQMHNNINTIKTGNNLPTIDNLNTEVVMQFGLHSLNNIEAVQHLELGISKSGMPSLQSILDSLTVQLTDTVICNLETVAAANSLHSCSIAGVQTLQAITDTNYGGLYLTNLNMCNKIAQKDMNKQTWIQNKIPQITNLWPKLERPADQIFKFDPNELKEAQKQDLQIFPIIRFLDKKELPQDNKLARKIILTSDQFIYQNELLYRIRKRPQYALQLVLPKEYQTPLIAYYHEGTLSNHLGVIPTYMKMSQYYYFEDMFNKIKHYVTTCEYCLKSLPSRYSTLLKARPVPHRPFATIHIDIAKIQHPTSLKGNNKYFYFLIVADSMSNFIKIIELKNETARETAKKFLFNWLLPYGWFVNCSVSKSQYSSFNENTNPTFVYSDNAKIFYTACFEQILSLLGLQTAKSLSYLPRSNSPSERSIQVVIKLIAKTMQEKTSTYSTCIKFVESALNSTPRRHLQGRSPFSLVYGTEYVDPYVSALKRAQGDLEITDNEVLKWADYIKYSVHLVRRHLKKYKQKIINRANANKKSYNFQLDERVLKRSLVLDKSKSSKKTSFMYHGPFFIHDKISESAVILRGPDGKIFPNLVATEHLKPFPQRSPNLMYKLPKPTAYNMSYVRKPQKTLPTIIEDHQLRLNTNTLPLILHADKYPSDYTVTESNNEDHQARDTLPDKYNFRKSTLANRQKSINRYRRITDNLSESLGQNDIEHAKQWITDKSLKSVRRAHRKSVKTKSPLTTPSHNYITRYGRVSRPPTENS